jgi:hypothetical protein
MPLFKIGSGYRPKADITDFIGDFGDLFYNSQDTRLRISDGQTPGGIIVATNNDDVLPFDNDNISKLTLREPFHLLPETDIQQDLGSPQKRWRDLYISGGTLFLGDNSTLKENTTTGSMELPAGTVMRSADGTSVDPVATIDVDSIDWATVLAGLDLGLEYATVPYVDGKFNDLDDIPNELSNLNDVSNAEPLDNAVLMYNAVSGLWGHNDDIVSDVSTLQTDVTNLTTTVETNTTNIASNTTNITNNATNITTAENAIINLNALTQSHTVTISNHATSISTIEGNVTNNADNITTIDTSLTNAISNITNLLSSTTELDLQQTTNTTNITQLLGDVVTLDNSLSVVNNNIVVIEGDITNIQTELVTVNNNISTLQTDLSALTVRVTTNEEDIAALQSQQTQNTAAIASNLTAIDTNTADIATNATAIESSAQLIQQNIVNVQELDTKHTQQQSLIDANTAELSSQSDLIGLNTAQTASNTALIQGLRTDVDTATGNVTNLQASSTLFDTRITTLELQGIPEALTDLGIDDGSNGQVLTTDGAGNFSFATLATGADGGGGTLSIDDLNDVDTSGDRTAGMYLKWSGSEWVPSAIIQGDVSGEGGSSTPSNGLVFEGTGTQRIGTVFNESGIQYTIREAFINNSDLLEIEIASFTPNCSASQTNLNWDEVATQFSVSIDNPEDFTSNYVKSVYSISNQVGFVLADNSLATIANYFSSGPSVTPDGGVDWTQTYTNQAQGLIRSNTTTLTGGSASATVNFLDANDDLISFSDPVVTTTNWANANATISLQSAPNTLFLTTIPSVNYTVNISGIADAGNYNASITTTAGTVTNTSGSGTLNFTTPLHKDNNTGRTLNLAVDFTRPAGVTGTAYTVTDTDTAGPTISTTWQYPSFYYWSASVSEVPTQSNLISGYGFDAEVTTTSHHGRTINTTITNSDSVPRVFWFGISAETTQPTTFQTGASSSLLSGVSTTTATVDLQPDVVPTGYNAVQYNLYGIVLQPGSTYVRIN